jgi:hypothetical protein
MTIPLTDLSMTLAQGLIESYTQIRVLAIGAQGANAADVETGFDSAVLLF